MTVDADMRAKAECQHGVLSRPQARALGATTSALRNRLAGPDWEAPTSRVLRLVGAPRTARQDPMVAVLDAGPGAVVGHRTAALLWQLPGFTLGTIELVRERGRSGCRATIGRVR